MVCILALMPTGTMYFAGGSRPLTWPSNQSRRLLRRWRAHRPVRSTAGAAPGEEVWERVWGRVAAESNVRIRDRLQCQLLRCINLLNPQRSGSRVEVRLHWTCGVALLACLSAHGLCHRSVQDYYNAFCNALAQAGYDVTHWPKAPSPVAMLRDKKRRRFTAVMGVYDLKSWGPPVSQDELPSGSAIPGS